jgi:hypothetical protein
MIIDAVNAMLLLKDGIKYFLHEYSSEEELAQMIVEHCKEIFGANAMFFGPQTMKTQIGIEARNDGIILAPDQNKWYILEVELSEHQLSEHIIPQITRFSMAYDDPITRKKITKILYDEIHQDKSKEAVIKNQKTEDPYKILTDLIDIQPTIAIIIDQKKPELDQICKKLPFPTQTTEFKTYARENIGIGVHIHEFQPLWEKQKKTEMQPMRFPQEKPQKLIPRKLAEVLEVAALVFRGEDPVKAAKIVAEQHGIFYQTVTDKMTRQLGIDMGTFRELIKDKNRFIEFLKKRYPQYQNLIDEKLS